MNIQKLFYSVSTIDHNISIILLYFSSNFTQKENKIKSQNGIPAFHVCSFNGKINQKTTQYS